MRFLEVINPQKTTVKKLSYTSYSFKLKVEINTRHKHLSVNMSNSKTKSVQSRKPIISNRKPITSYRKPITAKNIAFVQEEYENELKLREKSKIVLNGRVKPDKTSNDDSGEENDLEYEFLYSVSDEENDDHYSYEFDAYPVIPETLHSVGDEPDDFDDRFYKETELENNHIGNANSTSEIKVDSRKSITERVKSDSETSVNKPKGCLSKRPKSASLVQTEKETGSNRNEPASKEEMIKVAFKDTDSVVSKASSVRDKTHRYERRKSVSYDPDLEKASAYIHGGGKNFSRSNTSLTPMKYGMKHLQMNYTETNLETNQCVIFLDLLKNSHQKSQIRGEQIRNIERRLEAKRNNPHYSTSYYENKNIPDPFHRNAKKTARSVAQKKIERKEKIKQMTDEIHTGYVPTQLTMKIADRSEVEDIGIKCRYLRCQTPAS